MRAIMGKLIENKRRCANGLIKWDTTKVSRVLHNATYMGYISYNKSYRNNFLDQKIIRNKEEEFVLVKGADNSRRCMVRLQRSAYGQVNDGARACKE